MQCYANQCPPLFAFNYARPPFWLCASGYPIWDFPNEALVLKATITNVCSCTFASHCIKINLLDPCTSRTLFRTSHYPHKEKEYICSTFLPHLLHLHMHQGVLLHVWGSLFQFTMIKKNLPLSSQERKASVWILELCFLCMWNDTGYQRASFMYPLSTYSLLFCFLTFYHRLTFIHKAKDQQHNDNRNFLPSS